MKLKSISIDSLLAVAAALAMAALSGQAQNVLVTDSLTPLGSSGGVFEYSLQINNTGTEAIQSFWLGWIPGSFNVANPTSPGNNLGWTSVITDGSSVQYGGTVGTAIAAGHSGTFTFDSTTTPAEFMAQTGQAGQSTVYGINAANGQLSFTLSGADTETFGLTVVPEPSTFALLGLGSLVLLGALRRKPSVATVRIP